MNHYRHHLGDYAKDTAHLSLLEHGIYGQLMRRYYATETPLPADEAEVCRVIGARSGPERSAVRNILKDFFELHEDGYHQKRIDEEIRSYKELSAKASESAKRKWESGNAKAVPRHIEGNASQLASKPIASSQAEALAPPLAALAAVCLRCRVKTDGAKALLYLRQMVADGTTAEQLQDAILLARDRKPDPEVIPLAYLAPILADLRAGRVTAKPRSSEDVIARAMANIAAKEANAAH